MLISPEQFVAVTCVAAIAAAFASFTDEKQAAISPLVATGGAAITGTLTVASSQLLGLSTSQMRYVKLYVPAVVPAATITFEPLIEIPGLVALTCVITTVESTTGAPFS